MSVLIKDSLTIWAPGSKQPWVPGGELIFAIEDKKFLKLQRNRGLGRFLGLGAHVGRSIGLDKLQQIRNEAIQVIDAAESPAAALFEKAPVIAKRKKTDADAPPEAIDVNLPAVIADGGQVVAERLAIQMLRAENAKV